MGWRHPLTCRKLMKFERLDIRLGESRRFPGWISSNFQVFAPNFLDGRRSFKPLNNLNYVYLDNVIEHLTYEQGRTFLNNIFRAMVPGGCIRLATPDLRSICEVYLEGDQKSILEMHQDLTPHNLSVRRAPEMLRSTFCAFGHEKGYIYDFETLKEVLEDVGFQDVLFYRPGQSDRSKFLQVESRMSQSDKWSQMCIEARKVQAS